MVKYYLDSIGQNEMFDSEDDALDYVLNNDWYNLDAVYDIIFDRHGITDILDALQDGRTDLYQEWYMDALIILLKDDLQEVDFSDDDEDEDEEDEEDEEE